MKISSCKLLTILLLSYASIVNAQDEYIKKFHQEYGVDKGATFEISNKFGDIKIENTNADKIFIDAEIVVEAHSKGKADKMMDKISVDITKDGNIVSAVTYIDNISSKNAKFQINYTVVMPVYINTNLKNRYGNVTINELHGKNTIVVKYGSLNVNKIMDTSKKPLTMIDLGYCERSRINEFNWGKIAIKYSRLEVGSGKALAISSKYSKLRLGSFSSIVAESGYDDYNIESVANFVINAKYTSIDIEKLTKKLNVENKYGNISIGSISDKFESINVESEYANVNLGISKNAHYKLYAKNKYASIKYGNIEITQRIKDDFSTEIKGYSGSKDAKATVKVVSQYGGIDLRE